MLSNSLLKKFEKILLKEKQRIENILKDFSEKKTENDYVSKFPNYGTKEDEDAQEFVVYESRLSLEKSLEDELSKILKALDKIKKKEYGICEQCGEDIQIERLNAFPATILCIKCAKKKKI